MKQPIIHINKLIHITYSMYRRSLDVHCPTYSIVPNGMGGGGGKRGIWGGMNERRGGQHIHEWFWG